MLDRTSLLEREAVKEPDVKSGLERSDGLSQTPGQGPGHAGGWESSEYRGTITQAIREVEARTGAVGFVSADLAAQGKPRVVPPRDLVESIERVGERLGPGGQQRPVYTIGEGGSIVNTVTGRIEYLAVHGEAAKADLERAHAGAPGPGAKPQVPIDERIYASPGRAPPEVAAYSHHNDPISHPGGEPSGCSRRYGDADRETQLRCMDAIIEKGRQQGMTDHEIALTLAIARVESGFNPDAAAGSTSASGLGQMIDSTGGHYGLDASNRWNADAAADALVRHTQENMVMARAHGHGGADLDRYTYAYHHDGPSLAYGGLKIADAQVVPNVALYEKYVKSH